MKREECYDVMVVSFVRVRQRTNGAINLKEIVGCIEQISTERVFVAHRKKWTWLPYETFRTIPKHMQPPISLKRNLREFIRDAIPYAERSCTLDVTYTLKEVYDACKSDAILPKNVIAFSIKLGVC